MRQATRDRRARQLRDAAGDDNMLTLEQAADAFKCGINTTRTLLKELMTVGANIPAIDGYTPDWASVQAAQYYEDYEPTPAPLGKVTALRKKSEPGEFMQADDEPVEAEIWPPVATMPKKAMFYRLR